MNTYNNNNSNNKKMGSFGPSMSPAKAAPGINGVAVNEQSCGYKERCSSFQMPLHYPRYKKADYEAMPEWRLNCLLREYGLPVTGDVESKRKFAMGAFLWPDQY